MKITAEKVWIPLPDPIRQDQVRIELTWTADERTTAALRRQASCAGCSSVEQYIKEAVGFILATDESETLIAIDDDGALQWSNPDETSER